MTVEWNRVTWYSKLLAVIFFVLTFSFAFYLGVQYEKVWQLNNTPAYGTDSTGGEYGEIPDTSTSNSNVVATSTDITLRVGEKGVVNNIHILFNSVVNDSRCAVDVQCIQAGWVTTNVTFLIGSSTETYTLASNTGPLRLNEGQTISIASVAPVKNSKKTIALSDYRVTFHITEESF